LISGPTTVCKALLPDLCSNCDLLDASRGIHLLQKGPDKQITLEGMRVVPKDTLNFKYSALDGVDRNFRFALDGVRQAYKDKGRLRPIEDNP